VRKTKADRRVELAELMGRGAKVTVLASQEVSKAAKQRMDREYLSGWYAGAGERSFSARGESDEEGVKDGQRYRYRKAHGLEKYAGPQWRATLAKIEDRRLKSLETSPAR
jgi:hypothetical protein